MCDGGMESRDGSLTQDFQLSFIYPEEHYGQVTGRAFQLGGLDRIETYGYAHIECVLRRLHWCEIEAPLRSGA